MKSVFVLKKSIITRSIYQESVDTEIIGDAYEDEEDAITALNDEADDLIPSIEDELAWWEHSPNSKVFKKVLDGGRKIILSTDHDDSTIELECVEKEIY